jgi:diaminopropionate ammonia-lyase
MTSFRIRHVANPLADKNAAWGEAESGVLNLTANAAARDEIASWPGYAPTPLHDMQALAAELGIARLQLKDEAHRFGLKSFKALGGAYAVLGVLRYVLQQDHGIEDVTSADLRAGKYADEVAGITVCCATDGNHGRSVAWGAQIFGCRCNIHLHEHVSQGREDAIAAYGANIIRVPGHYDDSVRIAAEDATREGWHLVSDTAWIGYEDMAARVMQGYTTLTSEVFTQLLPDEWPTHVFLQAGVGGLAAAVAGPFWEMWGTERPRIIVVEPESADCVYRSISAGALTSVPGDLDTFMACLAAGEMSTAAWTVLKGCADDVLALEDDAARHAMRVLANTTPAVVAGESGCAGIAGLIAVCADADLRQTLGLDGTSRVLCINSEGDTDPEAYAATIAAT